MRARSAAIIRTVDDLPFEPTTWIDAKASLRQSERGHQPVHAVEPEAHAEQLEVEQVLARACVAAVMRSTRPSSFELGLCSARASRARSARLAAGRLSDEALVGELASARFDLGAQLLALRLDARRAPRPGRSSSLRQHVDRRAPRPIDRDSRRSPLPSRRRLEAREPPIASASPRSLRPPAAPGSRAAATPDRRRGSCAARVTASITASTSRSASSSSSARSDSAAGADREISASRARQEGPDLLGHERQHRVSSASICSSTYSSVARPVRRPRRSYRRGLTISRYQSQNSLQKNA